MENNRNEASPYTPENALRDADEARDHAAARLVTPWWYHPILGVAAAISLLGLALAPDGQTSFWPIVSIGIMVALIWAYRKITGVWVGPSQSGPRSRPIWIAYTIILVGAYVAALMVRYTAAPAGLAVLLAVALVVVTVLLGRRLDEALRADIRAGDTTLRGN